MIHLVDAVLQPGLELLADWSLRWAVLIVLVAFWLVGARPRRAATRILVCWVVVGAGLCLPLLPRWGPAFSWAASDPVGARVEEATPAAPAEPEDLAVARTPATPPDLAGVPAHQIEQRTEAHVPPEPDRAADERVAPVETLDTRRILILVLSGVWAVCLGLLLVRRLGGWLLLERLRRQAVPLEGAATATFAACRAELGLRRAATLASHPLVRSPVTFGLIRPTILVPPTWPAVPGPVQRGGLLHELAHLARYDDWSALALELVRVGFFFHPLVLWLIGRLECERELLCDGTAVSHGADPCDYARMVLDFSRQAGRLLPAALAVPSYPVPFGRRRTVKLRIEHLLEGNMSDLTSSLSTRRVVALGLLLLGLALGVGSFHIRAREPVEAPEIPPPIAAHDETPSEIATPETPYQVEPYHVLKIQVSGIPSGAPPMDEVHLVQPDGKVDLGPEYGKVTVLHQTLEGAEAAIVTRLKQLGVAQPRASVTLAGWMTQWLEDEARKAPYRIKPYHLLTIQAAGLPPDAPLLPRAHLVQPGGKVDLGPEYGKVAVAGLSLEDAGAAIEKHLKALAVKDPRVSVTLGGWEAKWHNLEKDGPQPAAKKPLPKPVDRQWLRYGGKGFYDWRNTLRTDLKPGVRVEAIKALSAFGTNGYDEEATAAIIEAARGYNLDVADAEESDVYSAASDALRKIGAAAVPALIDELKNGKRNGRRFAVTALATFQKQAKAAIPALLATIRDKEASIRRQAILSVEAIDPVAPGFVPALVGALRDDEQGIRLLAAAMLGRLGPKAKAAVPQLIAAFKDENWHVRADVLSALVQVKADARILVPALAGALKDEEVLIRRQALGTLANLGPEAKEAVPALIRYLKEADNRMGRLEALRVLVSIGPGAKEAIPAITELIQTTDDDSVRAHASQALKKINK
jgi:HEAT repeat protein/beta-lactamase regulating signal transducer with metallopeptidase domain/protein involved in polysaccharide export with SLBB domain